jgi:hypothetical protein
MMYPLYFLNAAMFFEEVGASVNFSPTVSIGAAVANSVLEFTTTSSEANIP